ncbi:unnamed protein product [Penicillium camemberti]|uniref:Str. FM013 n=1 Tax=Penicillium camemberti (strain FM 013) TaxID=1429867 RepID=A0A0G4PU87_PENC3|nr:unnamed protein product [Penicillium camemberti]
MGSSTGATVAAIVTSLLQKRRSICNFNPTVTMPDEITPDGVCICLDGFRLKHPKYALIYDPKIRTPVPMTDPSLSRCRRREITLMLRFSNSGGLIMFLEREIS